MMNRNLWLTVPALIVAALGLVACNSSGGSSSSGGSGGGSTSSISSANEAELAAFAHEMADFAADFADVGDDFNPDSGLMGGLSAQQASEELRLRTLQNLGDPVSAMNQTIACESGSISYTELANGWEAEYDNCSFGGAFGFSANGKVRWTDRGARGGYPTSFRFTTLGTTLRQTFSFDGEEFEFRMRGEMDGFGNAWNHNRFEMNFSEFYSRGVCNGETEEFRGRFTPFNVQASNPGGGGAEITAEGRMGFAEGGASLQLFDISTPVPVYYSSQNDTRPNPGTVRIDADDGTYMQADYEQGGVWLDINGERTFYTWQEFEAEFLDDDFDDCL